MRNSEGERATTARNLCMICEQLLPIVGMNTLEKGREGLGCFLAYAEEAAEVSAPNAAIRCDVPIEGCHTTDLLCREKSGIADAQARGQQPAKDKPCRNDLVDMADHIPEAVHVRREREQCLGECCYDGGGHQCCWIVGPGEYL